MKAKRPVARARGRSQEPRRGRREKGTLVSDGHIGIADRLRRVGEKKAIADLATGAAGRHGPRAVACGDRVPAVSLGDAHVAYEGLGSVVDRELGLAARGEMRLDRKLSCLRSGRDFVRPIWGTGLGRLGVRVATRGGDERRQ